MSLMSNPGVQNDTAKTPGDNVPVLITSTALLAANGARAAAIICNDHATQVVYLSLGGTAVANKGVRLNPAGGTIVLTSYTGAVAAISVGGTSTVTITEV